MYSAQELEDLGLFRQFNRDPFRKLLARWLRNAPTAADIQRAAEKSPDRWAQGAAILGRLAGFADHVEVTAQVNLTTLSDAELEARIAQLSAAIQHAGPQPPSATTRAVTAPRSDDHTPMASTPLAESRSPQQARLALARTPTGQGEESRRTALKVQG